MFNLSFLIQTNQEKSLFSEDNPTPMYKGLLIALVVGLCMVMGVHLITLTSYPRVFIDEPWYANAAWNWIQSGVNGEDLHSGLEILGSDFVQWPNIGFIGNLPWTLSFKFAGLGLFQGRLVSWVLGVLLVILTASIGWQSFNLVTGLLAALILALSSVFLQASHYIRPDIFLAVAIVCGYFVAVAAFTKEKWWAHLLAGLIFGLAADIHPNAFVLGLGLIALYVNNYRVAVFRVSGTWLCALGGIIGVAFYLAVHVLPNPSAFIALMELSFGSSHRTVLQAINPVVLIQSLLGEVGRYHFFDNGLEFALLGASSLYLALRWNISDRRLLIYVGTTFAGFVLLIGNKHDIYAILFYPFFSLIISAALTGVISGLNDTSSLGIKGFVVALLVLLLINSVIHFARPLAQSRRYDYYDITQQIRDVVPEGSRVMGLPNWWIGLPDTNYRSSLLLTYYNTYQYLDLIEGMETIRPDYLIVDSGLERLLVDDGYFPTGPGFEIYKLPKSELRAFLTKQGEVLAQFRDSWHGDFKIYRIHWP